MTLWQTLCARWREYRERRRWDAVHPTVWRF